MWGLFLLLVAAALGMYFQLYKVSVKNFQAHFCS